MYNKGKIVKFLFDGDIYKITREYANESSINSYGEECVSLLNMRSNNEFHNYRKSNFYVEGVWEILNPLQPNKHIKVHKF